MNSSDWLVELQQLILRHPEYGVAEDLGSLTSAERYGLLTWLRRMDGQ